MADEKQIVEKGNIFFFYRPKVGAEEVEDIEGAQRFYVVTAPEREKELRLFMMGQKKRAQGICVKKCPVLTTPKG